MPAFMHRRQWLQLLGAAGAGAAAGAAPPAACRFRRQHGRIHVLVDSKPFTTFHYGPEWNRPFLHPIVTPSGIEISRGVPPKAGEDSDRPWQRGLWYGHGDIAGSDFWSERVEETTGENMIGRMALSRPPVTDAGAATITAQARLISAASEPLGVIAERFRFSVRGCCNLIDAEIAISAEREDLALGDTAEGGLAVRLTEEFRDDRGVDMLNSEGVTGMDIWGKPARWVDCSARIFGRMAGLAIFDHPGNLRYPTRWNAQDYGLIAANPFAVGSFKHPDGNGQRTEGRWTIRRGSVLALRYRVVIHDGSAEEAGIEAMHQQFAGETPAAGLLQPAPDGR